LEPDPSTPVVDTIPPVTTPEPDPSTDPDEVCDGEDNDGDGDVDEGYADVDLDGVADCLDTECTLALPAAGTVAPLPECQSSDPAAVADPWNVTLEWSFTVSGAVVVSPVTGQLTDDNGDGVIDSYDVPDVAFASYGVGNLFIVSGDGSGEICHVPGFRS